MMNWSEIPPNHFWQQSLLTRKPESTGSSWKALTVRVWTLWKLEKEGRFAFSLRSSTENKICQLQGRLPSNVPAHGKQTNMRTLCFFRWWGAPRLWSWKSEALWEISCGVWLGPMLEWCWRSFFPSSTWHTKGRVNNSTFRVACGPSYFGWTELRWQWIRSWILLQDMLRGMWNLRTFHIAPHVRLKFLKEQLAEKVDVEEDIRKKTTNIGDCCTLTFYEFGNVHVQRGEYRQLPWFLCVWESRHFKYWKTDEPLLFLTNDVLLLLLLLLRDRDTDSHCPFLMVWLQPFDIFNQEKKSFQSDAGRKERADKRKADQKARKAKGKAKSQVLRYNFHQKR